MKYEFGFMLLIINFDTNSSPQYNWRVLSEMLLKIDLDYMLSKVGRFILVAFMVFFVNNIHSQTIIIDGIRLSDDTMGWQGFVNCNFYSSKNKSEFFKSDIGSKFQLRKGKSIFKSFNN